MALQVPPIVSPVPTGLGMCEYLTWGNVTSYYRLNDQCQVEVFLPTDSTCSYRVAATDIYPMPGKVIFIFNGSFELFPTCDADCCFPFPSSDNVQSSSYYT